MNQNILLSKISEEIFNQLPEEGQAEIASLTSFGEERNEKVKSIFAKYNIDYEQIAQKIIEEKQND